MAVYRELNEGGQVDFKGKAKAFLRAYGFLSSILPYTNAVVSLRLWVSARFARFGAATIGWRLAQRR